MRKSYLLFLFSFMYWFAGAQDYKHGVGIHVGGFDFYGPQTGHYGYHHQKNTQFRNKESVLLWSPAIQASYWHAFHPKIDLKLGLWAANIHYPVSNKDSLFIKSMQGDKSKSRSKPFYAGDIKLAYSILNKEKYLLSPYVAGGVSIGNRDTIVGLDLPLGLGVNIRIAKGMFLNWESNYRLAITNKNQNHLSHAIGLVYWWKGNKAPKPIKVPIVAPPPVVIPKDTDNDGLVDSLDKCPYHAGKKETGGCPDKDLDGVYDFEDRCPDVRGLALYQGCPDTDKDGIEDAKDKCPQEAGIAENEGCPEIKQEIIEKVNIAAKGINFKSGSAILTEESYKQLDIIVEALKNDGLLLVDIEGHTDNKGKPEKNLDLSQQRADVCKQYLISKGIDINRISSVGFGDLNPIGDNNTEEGRAKNRRTDFLLKR